MLKAKMGQPLKKIPALPTVMLNQFHPLAVKSYVERNRKEQKAIGEKSKSD